MPAMSQSSRPLGSGPAADPGDQSGISRRLQRLEDQMVDLQSHTAALESLGSSGATNAAAPSGGGFGGDSSDLSGRLANLEVQMQALTSQISDVMQRLQQMERQMGGSPTRGAIPPSPSDSQFAGRDVGSSPAGRPSQSSDMRRGDRSGSYSSAEPYDRGGGSYDRGGGGGGSWSANSGGNFGGRPDAPDRYATAPSALPPLGNDNGRGGDGRRSGDTYPSQSASISSPEARSLYDQAYSSLVKREYQAADTYFQEFLRQYPNDPLAGPAQYWLGESAFVAGEYRRAADNFLKSYTNFPNSDKAPESLLKLGISLKRMGNTSEACASFSELQQKFPQAQSVLQRAEAEKRRANC